MTIEVYFARIHSGLFPSRHIYTTVFLFLLSFIVSLTTFGQDCSKSDTDILRDYYQRLPFRFAALDSSRLYTINIPGSYYPEPAFYQTNKFARVVVDIRSEVQYVVLFNPQSDQVDMEVLFDRNGGVMTVSACDIFPSVKFHMTNEIQRAAIGIPEQWTGIPGYDIEAMIEELYIIEAKLDNK